jgi:hypothetical protein
MICMATPAFALTAGNEAAKASDASADGFAKRHSCRPTFAGLSAAREGWEQDRGPMLRKLRKSGAVRTTSCLQDGLLGFGFLYDDCRSVWPPECGRRSRSWSSHRRRSFSGATPDPSGIVRG